MKVLGRKAQPLAPGMKVTGSTQDEGEAVVQALMLAEVDRLAPTVLDVHLRAERAASTAETTLIWTFSYGKGLRL